MGFRKDDPSLGERINKNYIKNLFAMVLTPKESKKTTTNMSEPNMSNEFD